MATKKTTKKTAAKKPTTKKAGTKKASGVAPAPEKLVVIAGDSGVYVGWLAGGAASVKSDTQTTSITLRNARHLRRYYVAGKQGDGSTVDLAVRGLDTSSPSVTAPLIGSSTLVGVRRVFDVAAEAAASFGVPQ